MEDENLIKIQHFFEVDNRIKREMYRVAPPKDEDLLTNYSVKRYTDELEDAILYAFCEFKCISKDLFGTRSEEFKRIKKLESAHKHMFYKCGYDTDRLREFYKAYISNMEPRFVDSVKDSCVGYSNRERTSPVEQAFSVNELLHFFHSYVMNNEDILQSLPIINTKNNDFNFPISLRGIECEEFNELFENFPTDLYVAWTDMIAISEKKLLMMVRDRGHALTIEITLNHGMARVDYFIPKICNVDMVNRLPGVNKVDNDSIAGTGVFEVEIDKLQETIYDFISKVPQDTDMEEKKENMSR